MKEQWMKELDEAKAAQYKQVREHWLYQFAGMAMQGLLANHAGQNYTPNEVASDAALMARALIAELEKETKK